jgi:phosphoribosylformylglycinamidine (FGAM) synthase-like enzyme
VARLLCSAHDCSDGGLAVAVAESCLAGKIGAVLSLNTAPWAGGDAVMESPIPGALAVGSLTTRADLAFFGETPTLVVASVAPKNAKVLEDLCATAGVPCSRLGTVGGADLVMSLEDDGAASGGAAALAAGIRVPVATLDEVYETALRRALGE